MVKQLSITKEELLQLDAVAISEKIQKRELTSVQITEMLIEHIKQVNDSLNAFVEDRFDLALEEAREKDAKIDQADFTKQPLYGVPISMKESFHVKGMKTTGTLYHRKDIIIKEDAEVVRKLKEAGAIILGKTNTPSLCFCQETDNKLYGRTNNAWDKDRTASGSSGGEAALVAVGGSPVGMSSDIGGSIRFPSHFNGVVGFKAGTEQVSHKGHFPEMVPPLQRRMGSYGPIGKTVRDAKTLYKIVAKQYPSKTRKMYERFKIDILPTDNGFPLSKPIAKRIEEIKTFLETEYDTNWAIPPYFNDSALLWQEIMSIDGAKHVRKLAFNRDRVNLLAEYGKEKLTKRTKTHEFLSWALIGASVFRPSEERVKEIEQIIKNGDQLLKSHFKNRLLIMPVYHRTALKHGGLFKELFSIKKTFLQYMPYTAYANVWGLPALTIPVGFDDKKLPFGIQIISINGNEEAIFNLGEKLEAKFGGYKRSTLYDSE